MNKNETFTLAACLAILLIGALLCSLFIRQMAMHILTTDLPYFNH